VNHDIARSNSPNSLCSDNIALVTGSPLTHAHAYLGWSGVGQIVAGICYIVNYGLSQICALNAFKESIADGVWSWCTAVVGLGKGEIDGIDGGLLC